jgi:hypothetical protein
VGSTFRPGIEVSLLKRRQFVSGKLVSTPLVLNNLFCCPADYEAHSTGFPQMIIVTLTSMSSDFQGVDEPMLRSVSECQ